MALIKCEECKKEMSDMAKQCPNCGFIQKKKIICYECNAENDENTKSCTKCGAPIKSKINVKLLNLDLRKKFDNKKVVIPTVTILSILLIFTCYTIFFSNGKGLLVNTENKIWYMVQEEVANNLKQPDSAEFEDISKVRFFLINDDTYEVVGIVKGKNAIGVSVSNNFVATVKMNDGKPIEVTDVEFLGDETLRKRITTNEELEDRLENGQQFLTAKELDEEIKRQPLFVESAVYQDASKFYGSNAMLQAILYNNSDISVKNAEVAFVAWDKNKLPIQIKGWLSSSDGSYFSTLSLDTINLMPKQRYNGRSGDTYYGMRIDNNIDVSYLKAIVVSFEDFDGNIWYNPLLLDFKNLYENKKLVD
jgi:hypothetical protein